MNKKMEALTLDEKIGQLFVTGFPGKEPSQEFLSLVREEKVGNVILFSHNVSDKNQMAGLNRLLQKEIISTTGIIPIISIDEEGGVVTRLPKDTAIMPSAMAQAAANDKELIYQGARITGRQLRALGVNMNLAPVLDINSNINNPVIGVRSFGETREDVVKFGESAVIGYNEEGILCSGKHFPGHGDTDVDSHLGLPAIERTMDELENRELFPFIKLRKKLPAITIAHVVVPTLEPRRIPCTISKPVITDYLRNTLGYRGIIVSDCMEMNAMNQFGTIEENVVAALEAGIDLIFISHTSSLVKRAVSAVKKAVEEHKLSVDRIDKAVTRILAAKEMLSCGQDVNAEEAGTDEQVKFAEEFLEKTIFPLEAAKDKFYLGDNPLFIGIAPSRTTLVSNQINTEPNFSDFMTSKYHGTGIVCSLDPTKEELDYVKKMIMGRTSVVTGTLNAHLYQGQRKLLEIIDDTTIATALVSLRNPYDNILIGKEMFYISLYEYSERTLNILTKYFSQ